MKNLSKQESAIETLVQMKKLISTIPVHWQELLHIVKYVKIP